MAAALMETSFCPTSAKFSTIDQVSTPGVTMGIFGSEATHRVCCTMSEPEEPQMDAIAEKLDKKLQRWEAETAEEVRRRVAEIIELADDNALDLIRSRSVEQEVLDKLDEPTTR